MKRVGLAPVANSYFQTGEVKAFQEASDPGRIKLKKPQSTIRVVKKFRSVFPLPRSIQLQDLLIVRAKNLTELGRASKQHAVVLDRPPNSMAEMVHYISAGCAVILLTSALAPQEHSELHMLSQYFKVPVVMLNDEQDWDFLTESTHIDVSLNAHSERKVKVHNVVGQIRGTDADLKEEYFVVGAHYDHVGHALGHGFPRGSLGQDKNDLIWNGANDNASGVAALLECARLMMKSPPRRSVLFVAFYGEEAGFLGSRSFVAATPIALKSIVAMLNFEQLGRIDDNSRPADIPKGSIAITGYNYSTLPAQIAETAVNDSLHVYRHPQLSDAYFYRSDNAPFAQANIPAHTISLSYDFPDYHNAQDHADRLDYAHLNQVTGFLARAITTCANRDDAPKWLIKAIP